MATADQTVTVDSPTANAEVSAGAQNTNDPGMPDNPY